MAWVGAFFVVGLVEVVFLHYGYTLHGMADRWVYGLAYSLGG